MPLYARYYPEAKRWALLAVKDAEESLYHLEEDGTIWMVGWGQRSQAPATQQAIRLPWLQVGDDPLA